MINTNDVAGKLLILRKEYMNAEDLSAIKAFEDQLKTKAATSQKINRTNDQTVLPQRPTDPVIQQARTGENYLTVSGGNSNISAVGQPQTLKLDQKDAVVENILNKSRTWYNGKLWDINNDGKAEELTIGPISKILQDGKILINPRKTWNGQPDSNNGLILSSKNLTQEDIDFVNMWKKQNEDKKKAKAMSRGGVIYAQYGYDPYGGRTLSLGRQGYEQRPRTNTAPNRPGIFGDGRMPSAAGTTPIVSGTKPRVSTVKPERTPPGMFGTGKAPPGLITTSGTKPIILSRDETGRVYRQNEIPVPKTLSLDPKAERVWYGGKLWDQNRDGKESPNEQLIGSLEDIAVDGDVRIIRNKDWGYGRALRLDKRSFARFSTPEDQAIVNAWLSSGKKKSPAAFANGGLVYAQYGTYLSPTANSTLSVNRTGFRQERPINTAPNRPGIFGNGRMPAAAGTTPIVSGTTSATSTVKPKTPIQTGKKGYTWQNGVVYGPKTPSGLITTSGGNSRVYSRDNTIIDPRTLQPKVSGPNTVPVPATQPIIQDLKSSRVWYGGKLWDQNRDGKESPNEQLIGTLDDVAMDGDVRIIRDKDWGYGKVLRLDPRNFAKYSTQEDQAIVKAWLDLGKKKSPAAFANGGLVYAQDGLMVGDNQSFTNQYVPKPKKQLFVRMPSGDMKAADFDKYDYKESAFGWETQPPELQNKLVPGGKMSEFSKMLYKRDALGIPEANQVIDVKNPDVYEVHPDQEYAQKYKNIPDNPLGIIFGNDGIGYRPIPESSLSTLKIPYHKDPLYRGAMRWYNRHYGGNFETGKTEESEKYLLSGPQGRLATHDRLSAQIPFGGGKYYRTVMKDMLYDKMQNTPSLKPFQLQETNEEVENSISFSPSDSYDRAFVRSGQNSRILAYDWMNSLRLNPYTYATPGLVGIHELEHQRQDTYVFNPEDPRMLGPIDIPDANYIWHRGSVFETPAVLSEYVHAAEGVTQTRAAAGLTGGLKGQAPLSPNYQPSLEWMRQQARLHGHVGGDKSMTELLNTPEGQAWIKMQWQDLMESKPRDANSAKAPKSGAIPMVPTSEKELRDMARKIKEEPPKRKKFPSFFANGGIVYASNGKMIDFKPQGTDTIPAMLTPGEFVVNRESTRKNLPLLQNLNRGNSPIYRQNGSEYPEGFKTSLSRYDTRSRVQRKPDAATSTQSLPETGIIVSGAGTPYQDPYLERQRDEKIKAEEYRNKINSIAWSKAMKEYPLTYDSDQGGLYGNARQQALQDMVHDDVLRHGYKLDKSDSLMEYKDKEVPTKEEIDKDYNYALNNYLNTIMSLIEAGVNWEIPSLTTGGSSGVKPFGIIAAGLDAGTNIAIGTTKIAGSLLALGAANSGALAGLSSLGKAFPEFNGFVSSLIGIDPIELQKSLNENALLEMQRGGLKYAEAFGNVLQVVDRSIGHGMNLSGEGMEAIKKQQNILWQQKIDSALKSGTPKELMVGLEGINQVASVVGSASMGGQIGTIELFKHTHAVPQGSRFATVINRWVQLQDYLAKAEKVVDKIATSRDAFEQMHLISAEYQGHEVHAEHHNKGGLIYASNGQLVNFQPKGTDTVPAMLTPGEFVINRKATQNNLSLLKAINNGSYSHGDIVKKFNRGGVVNPGYYQLGGNVDRSNNFDFGSFMQRLMGQLSAVIGTSLREGLQARNNAQNVQQTSNGVSIDSKTLNSIGELTNRLKSIADTLAGLNGIPSEIKVTGRHDVNVIINGDSVLNKLSPEIQDIVMNEIKNSFNKLVNANKPMPSDKLINPFDLPQS